MNIVAILDRSAGNETVGEMWSETGIFDENTPVIEIVKWATNRIHHKGKPEWFTGNLRIAIGQEQANDTQP